MRYQLFFRLFAASFLFFGLSLWFLAGLSGCGSGDGDGGSSGISASSEVRALTDDDLRALCTEFVTTICPTNPGLPMCQDACSDLCDRDRVPEVLRIECPMPITVGNVRDCADAYASRQQDAVEICVGGMGGCVFDVGDALCQ